MQTAYGINTETTQRTQIWTLNVISVGLFLFTTGLAYATSRSEGKDLTIPDIIENFAGSSKPDLLENRAQRSEEAEKVVFESAVMMTEEV